MSPKTLRALGIITMFAAATVSLLNLKRVADLGLPWLTPILIVLGAIFMIRAQKKH